MPETVDDILRRDAQVPDMVLRDASVIEAMDIAFRQVSIDYVRGGIPSSRLGAGALSGMMEVLHGHQAAFLAACMIFGRMMYEQELEEAQAKEAREEYRIVSGAEAERLLRAIGRA